MGLKGTRINVNVFIAKVIKGKKIKLKSGSIKKYEDGNYSTKRFTDFINRLPFDKEQKYHIRINYNNKKDTQNTNHGIWDNREDMLIAWNSISANDTIKFMEGDR
jgi:predicted component of type VI protein secretion system